jgi:hypothetical protein
LLDFDHQAPTVNPRAAMARSTRVLAWLSMVSENDAEARVLEERLAELSP